MDRKPLTKAQKMLAGVVVVVILAFLFGAIGLALIGSSPSPSTSNPSSVSQSASQKLSPEKLQDGVRRTADFMVRDNNVIGLRMWARSLGISVPDFVSAETIREEIRLKTNDFAIYRDGEEVVRFTRLLSNQDLLFDEALLESIKGNLSQ